MWQAVSFESMKDDADFMAELEEMDKKQSRKKYASGFLELAKNESIPLMIDALLDAPSGRGFNKAELARKAGISPGSVRTHLDTLLELSIMKTVPDTTPTRYTLDMDSQVTRLLFELDNIISEIRTGMEYDDIDEYRVDWEDLVVETGQGDESYKGNELQTVGNPADEIRRHQIGA